MTKGQRKLLIRIAGLGLALTFVVIMVDGLGLLQPLERYIYDARARRFQFFSSPPSREVIHIDVDDPSVDEIGRWPWHRSVMAKLIDEIRLAGAKVIYLDIILYEPEEPQLVESADKQLRRLDHDQELADAMKRAANVLVPLSVDFKQKDDATPFYRALVSLLEANPELELEELKTALIARGFPAGKIEDRINSDKIDASKDAMFNRLERELTSAPANVDELAMKLLPRAAAGGFKSDATLLLYKTYPAVTSVLSVRRFGHEATSALGGILRGRPNNATIPVLCNAAKYVGFVDFLPNSDGRVRSVPLCADFRGTILPHIALTIACAQLGVDPKNVQYESNKVTIPLADDSAIVIPVRSVRSSNFGTAPMLMDIPWFGTADFARMFDPPNYAEAKQRIPMRNVWSIVQLQQDIERNNASADAAILLVLGTRSQPEFERYHKLSQAERATSRSRKIDEIVTDDVLTEFYDATAKSSPEELKKLDDKEQLLFSSLRALRSVRDRAQFLVEQLPRKRAALHQALDGKAILIGFTVTGGTDQYPTSLHPNCPGVSIIGTAVSGILSRDLWRTLPWWIAAAVTLVMGMATTFFVARLAPVPALLLSGALLAAYALLNALLLFDLKNYILPAAGTVTAVALCWSGLTLARFIIESRERARITRRFSNYVDPALVDYVIENPEQVQLDGKIREMTVVFTDLAGFTTISEKLREKTVPILNEYMSLMVPIIREHSGYWDKFLGDGIMFFYNGLAPIHDHAVRAIDTAMEMQHVTQRFNERLKQDGLPNVLMRAGISTGEMVVGDAGSKDPVHRANNFTVLGDAVNLGARLEGANKPIGTKILINGRTAELSEEKFLLRPVGNVRVVGKLQGVQLFEPLCRIETATDDQKKIVEFATTIVDSFAAADFEKCICAAKQMEEDLGSTKFSQFYMRIAREQQQNPSPDFEGQVLLSEK